MLFWLVLFSAAGHKMGRLGVCSPAREAAYDLSHAGSGWWQASLLAQDHTRRLDLVSNMHRGPLEREPSAYAGGWVGDAMQHCMLAAAGLHTATMLA